jgi:hypothetical protein
MRGRNRGGKSHNPLTRVYESNGPDVKIRGTANHIAEKYIQLARDATASGDPVAAENYYQHAEHYFRVIATAQEQFRQSQPFQQREGGGDENFDGDDDQQPSYGEPHSPTRDQHYQQPREHYQQREQRERYQQREQREQREHHQPREQREPRDQPYPRDYQPRQDSRPQQGNGGAQDDDVDRLPSFITGAPAQGTAEPNGGYESQGDRFPLHRRRRRSHRGSRSDMAGEGGGDDAPQQGQPPVGE